MAARARRVGKLPVDAAGGENTAGSTRAVQFGLSGEETRGAFDSACREVYRTRIDEVLLTALAETLRGWAGAGDVLVELEGHGREEIGEGVDVSRTVGWFTTLYPARRWRSRRGPGRRTP